jgi:hypothetical protein
MALQSSGQISISDIRTELSNTSGSLRTLSAAAGKSSPDAMSEFYGYSNFTSLPVTSSLVFSIQADDPACYSGTGTAITDTSGVGDGATLVGGTSWVSTGGKYWYCDGVNDYISVDPYRLPITATYITVAKSPTTNWNNWAGLGACSRGGGFIIHNDSGATTWRAYYYGQYTSQINLIGSGLSSTPTDWSMYTIVTHTFPSPYHSAYYNSTQVATSNAGFQRTSDPAVGPVIYLGRDDPSAGSRFNEIYIHAFLMYSRGLSSSEITSLWNYFDAKLP